MIKFMGDGPGSFHAGEYEPRLLVGAASVAASFGADLLSLFENRPNSILGIKYRSLNDIIFWMINMK